MQAMRSRRVCAWLLFSLLTLSGCIDGIGPRPRPGTVDPGEEPGGGGRAVLQWFEMEPRVVTLGATDSITLSVSVSGTPRSVLLVLRSGQPIEMRRVDGLYVARAATTSLLFGYRTGDLHQLGALIQISADSVREHPVILNIKDASVPSTSVTPIAPGIQMSDHVLNIRHDALSSGSPIPASVIRTFYNTFPDDFEFISVVEAVNSDKPAFYTAVRNNVTGIGLAPFDNGAVYGSASRLEGIIQFPDAPDYDPARTDNIHELAHRWMNYLEHPLLAPARTHWPLSTLANGIMGYKHPVTGVATAFPFELIPRADGDFNVVTTQIPRSFNDMELYLMGVLSRDSVQPHVVFANQTQQSQLTNGGVLRGPVDTVRIEGVIATNGNRTPAVGTAPRAFKMATIVLTRGGILSRQEFDFFEHMAARGEQALPLTFSNGVTRGQTQPFFLATGGRATLNTRIRNVQ